LLTLNEKLRLVSIVNRVINNKRKRKIPTASSYIQGGKADHRILCIANGSFVSSLDSRHLLR
jgi:hypothetical protein